jgi:hypothetical protein
MFSGEGDVASLYSPRRALWAKTAPRSSSLLEKEGGEYPPYSVSFTCRSDNQPAIPFRTLSILQYGRSENYRSHQPALHGDSHSAPVSTLSTPRVRLCVEWLGIRGSHLRPRRRILQQWRLFGPDGRRLVAGARRSWFRVWVVEGIREDLRGWAGVRNGIDGEGGEDLDNNQGSDKTSWKYITA